MSNTRAATSAGFGGLARCAVQIRHVAVLLRPHRQLLEPALRDFEPACKALARLGRS